LAELVGLFIPAQFSLGGGEDVGGAQGVGVVVAQDPATPDQGVLAEFAGRLVMP
jgi:hypothetical protein